MYPLVNVNKKLWKDPPFCSWENSHYFDWAISSSLFVCLPEGTQCHQRRKQVAAIDTLRPDEVITEEATASVSINPRFMISKAPPICKRIPHDLGKPGWLMIIVENHRKMVV